RAYLRERGADALEAARAHKLTERAAFGLTGTPLRAVVAWRSADGRRAAVSVAALIAAPLFLVFVQGARRCRGWQRIPTDWHRHQPSPACISGIAGGCHRLPVFRTG